MTVSVLGAAATSLLYAAAFPPYRYAVCAWIALVPFLLVIRRSRPGPALAAAICFPVFACGLTIAWMPRAAATYYAQPFAVGILTFLAIALLMVAPSVIAFTVLYRFLRRDSGAAAPLLGGSLWVCGEYARSHLLTGNPFVLLGYSQASAAHLLQIADATGVYGVSFVLAAVNVALAEILPARRRGGAVGSVFRGGAVAAGVAALAFGYGAWRLEGERQAPEPAVPILLVQGNLDLGSQWHDELYGQNLEVYLRLTLEGMRQQTPALVVWPENAMTFFVARERNYRMSIGRVLESGPVELLAGGPHFVQAEDRFLNSAFLLAPSGDVLARYDKQKLLPFAEYFPLPQMDILRRNFGRVREFTAGASGTPLPSAAGRAGILICNEAMFPEIASRRTRDGAEVLVNLTNDSWIADAQYAELAFDMAVFRAVEQRRYLIRSSTSGPSAVIDPGGRVRGRTQPGTRAVLHGEVAKRSSLSVYARAGDVFVGLCVAWMGVGVVFRARRRRASSGRWHHARGRPVEAGKVP